MSQNIGELVARDGVVWFDTAGNQRRTYEAPESELGTYASDVLEAQ